MVVYRDKLQLKLELHVVNARLKARYVTRLLVALTSQVYAHIPGEGSSEMSAYFAKRRNDGEV